MSNLSTYQRTTGLLGTRVHYFSQLTSTNDWLLQLAEQGAPEGTLVVADEQTAGRGRMGRRWSAPPGTALLFSLLFRPASAFMMQAPRITMLCGLALVEAVRMVTDLPVQLKWPNDLILGMEADWRKLAGMLTDVGMQDGAPAFLVVGIGVNVNVPAAQLEGLAPNAGSLLAVLGRPVDRVALLETFLERADAYYAELCQGWDPLSAWSSCLAWVGREVVLHTPSGTVSGIFDGVERDGALILRAADGWRRAFNVGDVSVRLAQG